MWKPIATTITEVDPDDPEWAEKAAEITGAVSGDTYVKLDHGILTVNQIDMFLKAMPFESVYADDNNQFYTTTTSSKSNNVCETCTTQSGSRMMAVHGSRMKSVEWVIGTLRNEIKNTYVQLFLLAGVINTRNCQAMYYPDGSYAGINEMFLNLNHGLTGT